MLRNFIQALRLPFVAASLLPFIFGSLIIRENFNFLTFILGIFAVLATHSSANLINDYIDSRTGADWQDTNPYQFFGGSKLIQQNIFSERFYLKTAIIFVIISTVLVICLSLLMKNPLAIILYSIIVVLSWLYSVGPISFSYHKIGELIIFILFGPVLVMGGYFIQTKIFPDLRSFLLSLPFGLFTTAILFANEVPDFYDDQKVGKNTWVGLIGIKKAFILYYFLIFIGFLTILINVILGFLSPFVLFLFLFLAPAIKAAKIIKNFPQDKIKLIQSSRLTIIVQNLVSLGLIAGILFFNPSQKSLIEISASGGSPGVSLQGSTQNVPGLK